MGRNAFTCDTSWSNTPQWRTNGKSVRRVLSSLSITSKMEEYISASSAAASAASAASSEGADTEAAIPSLPALLPQQAEPHLPEADAEDAAQVQINFQSVGSTGFAYNTDTGTYGMLHADGTPQLDSNTGTQAQFDNLLILYSGSSLRDDGRTLDYDLTLGGGVWLNQGQLWHITWTQGSDSTFLFYSSDGRPLTLRTGRSYIALVSSVTGAELSVQSSAGEELIAH